MDSSGPEGINRAVPVEKIADSLTGMPVDQFSHIVKTLRDAPPELQPQAQAALGRGEGAVCQQGPCHRFGAGKGSGTPRA
jgi:hypothetical protein